MVVRGEQLGALRAPPRPGQVLALQPWHFARLLCRIADLAASAVLVACVPPARPPTRRRSQPCAAPGHKHPVCPSLQQLRSALKLAVCVAGIYGAYLTQVSRKTHVTSRLASCPAAGSCYCRCRVISLTHHPPALLLLLPPHPVIDCHAISH